MEDTYLTMLLRVTATPNPIDSGIPERSLTLLDHCRRVFSTATFSTPRPLLQSQATRFTQAQSHSKIGRKCLGREKGCDEICEAIYYQRVTTNSIRHPPPRDMMKSITAFIYPPHCTGRSTKFSSIVCFPTASSAIHGQLKSKHV